MKLADLIARVFSEAMPRGDLTSRHLKLESTIGGTKLFAREDLVFAGRETFETALGPFAPHAEYKWQFKDGDEVLAGQNICWIKAPPNALLATESIALDLLGRACGIATLTRQYVTQVEKSETTIVCGRQLTPGLKELDLPAVRAGGAQWSTGDCSDTLYISRNYALAAGSLRSAIERVRREYPGDVTAECDSIEDVRTAVEQSVARVVLTRNVEAALARPIVPRRITLEAGDLPTLEETRALARANVDIVRVSQLTTAAPAKQLGLSLPPK